VITIAIPTGYLLPGSLSLIRAAGLADLEPAAIGRRLIIDAGPQLRLITVRPQDVPVYVDHGSADLGIVGKDALWETERMHYELLDLFFGACRLVMAVPDPSPLAGRDSWPPFMRVATKYLSATGNTLRANHLREVVEVGRSTARLIANQVSLRTRGEAVQEIVTRVRAAVRPGSAP